MVYCHLYNFDCCVKSLSNIGLPYKLKLQSRMSTCKMHELLVQILVVQILVQSCTWMRNY